MKFCSLKTCSYLKKIQFTKLNASINFLHNHSNLFLMLVESDFLLSQEWDTNFVSVWVIGLKVSYLIIVHLDLQEIWAYMLWFNKRTQPRAIHISYVITRKWCIKCWILLITVIVHINYLVYKLTRNYAYPVWTPVFLFRLDDNEEKFEGQENKIKCNANKTRPHHQCDNSSQVEWGG